METVDQLKSCFRPCRALHLHLRNAGHSARCTIAEKPLQNMLKFIIAQKFVLVKRPPFSAAFDAVLRGRFEDGRL